MLLLVFLRSHQINNFACAHHWVDVFWRARFVFRIACDLLKVYDGGVHGDPAGAAASPALSARS